MTILRDEEYWSSQFEITLEDLDLIQDRLERSGVPQDLKSIALPVLKGRIADGHDLSSVVQSNHIGNPTIRFWNPAGEWEAGNLVLLTHDRFGNSSYEPFLGVIVHIDPESVEIKIEELQSTRTFLRVLPGTENALKYGSAVETWQTIFHETVEKKLQSGNLDEQAEGLLLKHGERILTRLAESLQLDARFTSLEGRWYVSHRLPRIDGKSLQAVHSFLLQSQPASLDDILPLVRKGLRTDSFLLKMAIHAALQQAPERFEDIGTSLRPQWQARLPKPEQADVTHYAYDSQTYEILCRPGQRLSQKKARRLQELDLYAHVVTFSV